MDRRPPRTMSTSGTEMNPRPFRLRKHDVDVFYALVGGSKNAATLTDEAPANAAGEPVADPQTVPDAPVTPVRRPPAPIASAAVAVETTADPIDGPDERAMSGTGPADWAAALHGIAPAPRPVSRTKAKPVRPSPVSWSPKVLCKHLVDRVDQLNVDSWVRKVSGDAMRRLSQAQTRLNSSRPKHP